jgi:hypothetical protein
MPFVTPTEARFCISHPGRWGVGSQAAHGAGDHAEIDHVAVGRYVAGHRLTVHSNFTNWPYDAAGRPSRYAQYCGNFTHTQQPVIVADSQQSRSRQPLPGPPNPPAGDAVAIQDSGQRAGVGAERLPRVPQRHTTEVSLLCRLGARGKL